jgi:hypothetical protein
LIGTAIETQLVAVEPTTITKAFFVSVPWIRNYLTSFLELVFDLTIECEEKVKVVFAKFPQSFLICLLHVFVGRVSGFIVLGFDRLVAIGESSIIVIVWVVLPS